MSLTTVPEAIEDIRCGRFVIVVDAEDRENEGDLTLAAERVTPEAINFMAKHGRGLVCLPIGGQRLDELRIPPMVAENTSPNDTAFTVSVDARTGGVTTGISAADRSRTILAILDPRTQPGDLARPGHVFPLRAREGGVLTRPGQTEAAVDLARLAGLYPAGVICEVMNDDGTMARMPQLVEFGARHGIKILTIAQLIAYRLETDQVEPRGVGRKSREDAPRDGGPSRSGAVDGVLSRAAAALESDLLRVGPQGASPSHAAGPRGEPAGETSGRAPALFTHILEDLRRQRIGAATPLDQEPAEMGRRHWERRSAPRALAAEYTGLRSLLWPLLRSALRADDAPIIELAERVEGALHRAFAAALLAYTEARLRALLAGMAPDRRDGLGTTTCLNEVLAAEVRRAERYRRPFAILLALVEGLGNGDGAREGEACAEALRLVAGLLRSGLRRADTLGRYGRKGFLAVLPETPAAGARSAAERLRCRVDGARITGPRGHALSLAIGLATYPDGDANVESLLATAQAALDQTPVQAGRSVNERRARS